jgi:hypothetical protein
MARSGSAGNAGRGCVRSIGCAPRAFGPTCPAPSARPPRLCTPAAALPKRCGRSEGLSAATPESPRECECVAVRGTLASPPSSCGGGAGAARHGTARAANRASGRTPGECGGCGRHISAGRVTPPAREHAPAPAGRPRTCSDECRTASVSVLPPGRLARHSTRQPSSDTIQSTGLRPSSTRATMLCKKHVPPRQWICDGGAHAKCFWPFSRADARRARGQEGPGRARREQVEGRFCRRQAGAGGRGQCQDWGQHWVRTG